MSEPTIQRLGALRDVDAFLAHASQQQILLPCDREMIVGAESPLAWPVKAGPLTIGNRIAIHPMEGWDGTSDGRPTDATFRRWRRFGASGAKMIWGGEAVAVRHDGRANPNQLVASHDNVDDLSRLREGLVLEHQKVTGSADGLVVGMQLTHSGRYSVPNVKGRPEPRIAFRHPILDQRVGVTSDAAIFSDDELRRLIEDYAAAAGIARRAGFDFVDIKHCHGYLGHELLGAHTRPGEFGGSFENRTRFLREIVSAIRALAPDMHIGVRLSAFDLVPFRADPEGNKTGGKPGRGMPEPFEHLLPYQFGFGVNESNPLEPDLAETVRFLSLLTELGIFLVNLTAGSPYYNPHVQRPAFYPPSDGYLPPEDPLVGVARQMDVVRKLKMQFPELLIVGTGYSYLQEFLPNVAQAAIREGWVDCVGLGRVVLSYPEILSDPMNGNAFQSKRVCRTFSDCTTAPRKGLPSGCYPLDDYYKDSENAAKLKVAKQQQRGKK